MERLIGESILLPFGEYLIGIDRNGNACIKTMSKLKAPFSAKLADQAEASIDEILSIAVLTDFTSVSINVNDCHQITAIIGIK